MDHARDVFTRMGFTLTPVNRHPFGTFNSLIQLQGNFIELLGAEDPDLMPEGKPGAFNWPRFNYLFLERHEGLSMLALESAGADADAEAFARGGVQAYLPFEFSRKAALPGGGEATVGFRLAFASDRYMPEAMFFSCQQLAPEHFWQADYQRHENSALRVEEVTMVADEPVDIHRFLEVVTGNRSIRASSMGLKLDTPRGRIDVLTPRAATSVWGDAIDAADFTAPRFAACTISVDDLEKVRACLRKGGVEFSESGDRLVVPAKQGFGAAIAFVPAKARP
ncbi:MAG: VOC family protein [Rhodobiaceae bacterium]|nr:VOC family protein [Rhodobiaceae bacterium]